MQNHEAGQRAPRGRLIALMIATMIAAGCGGGGGDGNATADSSSPPQGGANPGPDPTPQPAPTGNTPPTISATPVAQVNVGAAYKLAPSAQDADGDALAFSIENRPVWATFNTATGQLTGTPSAQHVGAHGNVVISVSDGTASVSLPAFSITVAQSAVTGDPVASGAVALSWDVPTQTVEGDLLDNLAGYRVHYGKSADALTNSIEIPGSGGNQYVVQGLQPGTYYFAVRAVTQTGAQSATSNIVSRQVS